LKRSALRSRPKPPSDAKTESKQIIAARSDGLCEIGVTCSGGAYANDPCHRVGQGQGGPWDAANLLAGCRECHGYCHAWPEEARLRGGWILRSTDDYLTFPVHHAVRGWVLLASDGTTRPTQSRPEVA